MQVEDPEPVVCEETSSINNTPPHTSIKVQSPPHIFPPIIISQESLNMFTMRVSDDRTTQFSHITPIKCTPAVTANPIDIEHFCAPVTHPTTGEIISKYTTLQKVPEMKEVWTTGFGKEFGSLAQGDNNTGSNGTNSIFFIDPSKVKNIPKDSTIAYGRIVIDYRAQKNDPNRVCITSGGNFITYMYLPKKL